MGLQGLRYFEPQFQLRVTRGFPADVSSILNERILSIEEVDSVKPKNSHLTLVLDNGDGQLAQWLDLALGIGFTLEYGYRDRKSPQLEYEVRKITGAALLGSGPHHGHARTGWGGQMTFEGRTRLFDLHAHAGARGHGGRRRRLRYEAMTVPQVVREIALSYGFVDGNTIIEERPNDEVRAEIVLPADQTDAQWLVRQAALHHYDFSVGADGFRWHSRSFVRLAEETFFYFGDPDVISWDVEGDLNVACEARARAIDSRTGGTTVVAAQFVPVGTLSAEEAAAISPFLTSAAGGTGDSHEEPIRDAAVDSDDGLVTPARPDEGTGTSPTARTGLLAYDPNRHRRCWGPDDVTSAGGRAKLGLAAYRRVASAADKWKLKMRVVGNARVRAHRKLVLTNFGPMVDGAWYCKEARHRIDAGSVYITEIEAGRHDMIGAPICVVPVAGRNTPESTRRGGEQPSEQTGMFVIETRDCR